MTILHNQIAEIILDRKHLDKFKVKFPHSSIPHNVLSSWIEKTVTKIGKPDLFYSSMGLCGSFTDLSFLKRLF